MDPMSPPGAAQGNLRCCKLVMIREQIIPLLVDFVGLKHGHGTHDVTVNVGCVMLEEMLLQDAQLVVHSMQTLERSIFVCPEIWFLELVVLRENPSFGQALVPQLIFFGREEVTCVLVPHLRGAERLIDREICWQQGENLVTELDLVTNHSRFSLLRVLFTVVASVGT